MTDKPRRDDRQAIDDLLNEFVDLTNELMEFDRDVVVQVAIAAPDRILGFGVVWFCIATEVCRVMFDHVTPPEGSLH